LWLGGLHGHALRNAGPDDDALHRAGADILDNDLIRHRLAELGGRRTDPLETDRRLLTAGRVIIGLSRTGFGKGVVGHTQIRGWSAVLNRDDRLGRQGRAWFAAAERQAGAIVEIRHLRFVV